MDFQESVFVEITQSYKRTTKYIFINWKNAKDHIHNNMLK